MKRLFDIVFSLIALIIFFAPMLIIAICVLISSKGSILFYSKRVGCNNIVFKMPKFRSMKSNAPLIATHLISDVEQHLSPIGGFLRRYSLDELPQLYSILKGDMSFIGPRPALFNQYDLIELRTNKGLSHLKPGLTGWAQVNGRDDLTIAEKVLYEVEYLNKKSFWLDLKIVWLTFLKVIKTHGVSH
jgi:O-antigen biosynthesis protein WbqP